MDEEFTLLSGVDNAFDEEDGCSLDGTNVDEAPDVTVGNNEVLLSLLQRNDYSGFKSKLNLPRDLEDNDDVVLMMNMMQSKGKGPSKPLLFKNLFNLLCCLAGESLDRGSMGLTDQYLNFNTQFVFWLEHLALKEEFTSDLLRHFPDKELPVGFNEYVQLMEAVPTVKWITSLGIQNMPVDKQNKMKFGSIVKSHFDAAKREINNNANPLWISPSKLPSGVSEYAYTYFIRQELWPQQAFAKAKNAMKTAVARVKRYEKTKKNKTKKGPVEVEDVRPIEERLRDYPFEPSWYPDWWLTFLFLGLPAGNKCRDSLVSGVATTVASLSTIRECSNRANRRAIDKASAGSSRINTPTTDASTISSSVVKKRQLDITLHESFSNATYAKKKALTTLLEGHLKSMRDYGISPPDYCAGALEGTT